MALAFQYSVDSWLAEHMSILWLLQHPFVSVVGFVITLVLFARLLVAIATLIDRLWLWILGLPITLFQSIFTSGNRQKDNLPATVNYELTTNPKEFEQILQKLNAIEQQQKQILQDLAAIKNNSQSHQGKKPKLIKQIKGKISG